MVAGRDATPTPSGDRWGHALPERKELDDEGRRAACLGEAPRYEDFAEPTPNNDEAIVSVRAASLKHSDMMMADGSHYDSIRQLPAVVGLDGVGVLEDGTRVYRPAIVIGTSISHAESQVHWQPIQHRDPARAAPDGDRSRRRPATRDLAVVANHPLAHGPGQCLGQILDHLGFGSQPGR